MRITGVVKCRMRLFRIEAIMEYAGNKGLVVKVLHFLSDCVVVEFTEAGQPGVMELIYSWFQETSGKGTAPFPDGTLLSYSTHDGEKKPQASSESELLKPKWHVLKITPTGYLMSSYWSASDAKEDYDNSIGKPNTIVRAFHGEEVSW